MLVLSGCSSEEAEPRELGLVDRRGAEAAFPDERGELREGHFHVGNDMQTIHYEVKNGLAIHQGDIVLGAFDDLSPMQRGEEGVTEAAVKPDSLWGKGIVPYVIDDALPQKARDAFFAAVSHWEDHTALDFVERNSVQPDYIRVISGDGCYSHLGRIGGAQDLSLGPGCETMGIAVHEIGHAIGFYHEQSRSDRDENVIVHWENIQEDYVEQFFTYEEMGSIGEDVGGYNIDSIMHYGSSAFSIGEGRPTITRLDGSTFEVNRERLANTDLEGAVRLYGPPGNGDKCGLVDTEHHLERGRGWQSCDGRFTLVMQNDGNLVLYQGMEPLWHAGTDHTSASFAVMQHDGNLVVYEAGGKALWASGTHGNGNSALIVQDDGNLVIYSPEGKPIWASDTCCR